MEAFFKLRVPFPIEPCLCQVNTKWINMILAKPLVIILNIVSQFKNYFKSELMIKNKMHL